ncbi:hypothetical protein GCM10023083_67620 [Streptomyces phyllanthi]
MTSEPVPRGTFSGATTGGNTAPLLGGLGGERLRVEAVQERYAHRGRTASTGKPALAAAGSQGPVGDARLRLADETEAQTGGYGRRQTADGRCVIPKKGAPRRRTPAPAGSGRVRRRGPLLLREVVAVVQEVVDHAVEEGGEFAEFLG